MPFTTGMRPSTRAATCATWLRHIAVRTVSLTVTALNVVCVALWLIPDLVDRKYQAYAPEPMNFRTVFRFPDTVNETSARLVAAGVIAESVAFLIFREGWLLVPLVYGFLARVLAGPTMSPLGQFVTRVATPNLEAWLNSRQPAAFESRIVPGPPKRFAQGVGLAFTSGAALAWIVGAPVVSYLLVALLIAAATLESVFAVCLGCIVYNAIWGCAECADITQEPAKVPARN